MIDNGDILTVEGLAKTYASRAGAIRAVDGYASRAGAIRAVDGLEFTIQTGEFVSIVGPSGCGKSTILMMLAGLEPSSRGRVLFDGAAITAPPRGVSVVFQDYRSSLLPWKRNLDNVLFGMRRIDAPRAQKRRRALETLAAVGLSGFERHYPWQLSGGMQQRVAIARALGSESRLLLLDEPLAAVDAQTRADLQDLLLDLAERFKLTCVLVTHDVDEAVYLGDRVLALSSRPARIVDDIAVDLPKPRDALASREDPRFLAARHRIVERLRGRRQPAA